MEYAALLQLPPNAPVDRVVGRIKQVDLPSAPIVSRIPGAAPQTCQDIVIETEDRGQVAIAFWDLSNKCFGERGPRELWAFNLSHEGRWIEVRNREVHDKPSLRRLKSKAHAARGSVKGKLDENWAAKGVHVYLKATSGCSVSWLLDDDDDAPRIGPAQRVKKQQRIEAPGKKQEKKTVTQTADKPNNEGRQVQDLTRLRARMAKLGAAVKVRCRLALRELYITNKVNVSNSFIIGGATSIYIELTKFRGPLYEANVNLHSAHPDQIKGCIVELAKLYFDSHAYTVEAHEKAKEEAMTEDQLRAEVTSVFISTLAQIPIQLQAPPKA